MNNDLINDYLKKRINSEKINVSPLVNSRIDETLSKLQTKKRRSSFFKTAVTAASISVVMIAVSTVLPVSASEMPIIGSVFRYFMGSNNHHNEVVSEYIKYSKDVKQSVDKNGIKFIVDEVSCDINSLIISYTIESKSKINADIDDIYPSSSINGKPIGLSYDVNAINIDDNTVKGMFVEDISKDNLPSNFDLNFNISSVGSVKGDWNFKFNVSKEASSKSTKVYTTNTLGRLPLWTYTVNKITMSPFSNSISISGTSLKDLDKMPYEFFVLNSDNNALITKPSTFSQRLEDKKFKMSLDFIKGKDQLNSITLLPYTVKYSSEYDFVVSKAVNELPATINIGNKGVITINSVTVNDTNTIVNYAINGYTINPLPALVDEDGKKILPKEGARAILVDASKGEYQIEFPKINKNKIYKVAAIKNPSITLLEENKLVIQLK